MNNIESSLIKTITESDLSSVVRDVSEIGLDSILKDGLAKEIPVLSTIIGVVKTGGAIRDYLYFKKLYRFLSSLNEISPNVRQEFVEKLGNTQEEREKSGENLLLIIDRLDNVNKPEILGYMFADYLQGVLSKSDFMLLAKSLELFNLELTVNIINYYSQNNEQSTDDILQSFAMCGLVGMVFGSGGGFGGHAGGFRKNKLGELFVGYINLNVK